MRITDWAYMAMIPLGYEFGQNCLESIQNKYTVCLLKGMPHYIPSYAFVEKFEIAEYINWLDEIPDY
jgi:hypothetical protein